MKKDVQQNINLFLELTKEKISRLFYAIERIETKASIIIGFLGIILGYILVSANKNFLELTISNLGILSLFISFFFAISIILTAKYRDDPDPEKILHKYKDKNPEKVKEQLLANLIDSYNKNKSKLSKKVKLLKYSFGFLLLGLILLVIG